MTNAECRKGQTVVIREGEGVRGLYLTADFPGWGDPDHENHLAPLADVAGMTATVTSVNSHGNAPHTRYTLRLANGGRIIDAVPGNDFDWTPWAVTHGREFYAAATA